MIKPREFHELASLFPMLPETEINLLAQDIKTNGLMSPITLYGDKILDGRNRYKACELAGVEPFFTEYTGNDPLQYVISLNLSRRHLNESQRAVVAEKIAIILKNDDPELKSKASTERWDRERELKEINDNTQLTWDQKQAMSGHLKSIWNKRAISENKASSRKLYVAKSGDRIKVGVSSFPESRIDYLRCADPSIELLKVFNGGFQ